MIEHIPGERTLDRIDELEEYIRSFPAGMRAAACRHELTRLYDLCEAYGLARFPNRLDERSTNE